MTDPPERRAHLADWGSLAVVLAVALAHLRFVVVDGRLPKDMGLYFASLPEAWTALGALSTLPDALGVLLEPGGWYVLLLAALMRVVGRAPEVIQVMDGVWVTWAVAAVALVGRRLGGPRAGLAAVSLLAMPTMVVFMGRTSWIHVPEVALVLTALYALLVDPQLRSRAWTAVVAASCALAVALRPSGLIWVATLLPLLLPAWRAHRSRVLAVLLAEALAALVLVASMGSYLVAKLDARPRYAEHMPGLLEQGHAALGPPLLALGALGLVLAWRHLRWSHAVVLGLWLVLPAALVGIFLAGLDNFPFAAAALALGGGVGLARHRWATGLAVGAFAVVHGSQYLTLPYALNPPWYALTGQSNGPGPGNFQKPYTGFAGEDVIALVHSTCDPLVPCTVVVDQGLFAPYPEEPGEHELFLMGQDRVHLVWIASGDVPSHLDALANYDCGDRDLVWRQRYPASIDALMTLVERYDLEPAWEGDTQPGCRLLWLTPGGEVPRPELLPEALVGLEPGAAFSPGGAPGPGQGPPLGPDGRPLLLPDGTPMAPPPLDPSELGALPDGPRLPPAPGQPPPPPAGPQPGQPPGEAPVPDGATKPMHLGEVPPTAPGDELEAHRVRPGHSEEER